MIYIEKIRDKNGKRKYRACCRDASGDVVEILETYTKKSMKQWIAGYRAKFDWSAPYKPTTRSPV